MPKKLTPNAYQQGLVGKIFKLAGYMPETSINLSVIPLYEYMQVEIDGQVLEKKCHSKEDVFQLILSKGIDCGLSGEWIIIPETDRALGLKVMGVNEGESVVI